MARRAFIIDGDKVREARERLGLNQPELARRCGITQAGLSRIESGERNASPALMLTIASVLGTDFDSITRRAPETEEVAS
jgi:transcriptional regulator with XRE-family HTH domain